MRRSIFLSVAIFLFTQITAQTHWQHGRLKVGHDKYYAGLGESLHFTSF
jgi:hypothetical protein